MKKHKTVAEKQGAREPKLKTKRETNFINKKLENHEDDLLIKP